MMVGLINIEPKIHNTAYMQIAAYHRAKGDEVDWYAPLADLQFERIYCSSLFEKTDKKQIPARARIGGTGFKEIIDRRLEPEIEIAPLDYSIYPNCKTSYIWFSRGCNNKCPFCVVHQKEGSIHWAPPKNLNPNGLMVTVQDNSFFDNPGWIHAVDYLRCWGKPVDITNVNVRTITEEQCWVLSSMKLAKRVKVAWDNPKQDIRRQLTMMANIVKPRNIMCYVLINYWSTPDEDMMRVRTLKEFGIDPYVMVYGKNTAYTYHFARWVNRKELFKSVPWSDYRRHGVTGRQIMEAMK